MIEDSGERTIFETGAVRDIQKGKGRCDLLPLDVISEVTGDDLLTELSMFVNTKNKGCLHKAINICMNTVFEGEHDALLELAVHFEEGAEKYGIDNWKKGIPEASYIDSAIRHYLKYRRGDYDERHDRACLWNLICLKWTLKNKSQKEKDIKYE